MLLTRRDGSDGKAEGSGMKFSCGINNLQNARLRFFKNVTVTGVIYKAITVDLFL